MGVGTAMARKEVGTPVALLVSVGLLGGVFMGILVFAGPHIWAQAFRSGTVAYLTFYFPFYFGLIVFDLFITVLSDVIRGYANPAPEALANFTAVCILALPMVAILALKSHLVGKSIWVGLIPVFILIFVKTAAIEKFRLLTDWEEKDIMTMRRWSGQSTLISCMLVMGVVRKPFGIGVNKAELPASSGKEEPVSNIEEGNLNLPMQQGET